MEFGFEPGRRSVRSWSKPNSIILVADRSKAGRRPASSLLASQISARCRSATSFGPVCDQDSVMEFGLNLAYTEKQLDVFMRLAAIL